MFLLLCEDFTVFASQFIRVYWIQEIPSLPYTYSYNLCTILIFCMPEPVKGNFISLCSVYELS